MKPLPRLVALEGGLATLPTRRSRRRKADVGLRQDRRLELRAHASQVDGWTACALAEGYLSLSDWIRDRLDRAAATRPLCSSDSDEWFTPPVVLELVARIGAIGLDPCGSERSPVRARVRWTIADDGLSRPWETSEPSEIVYVNPPYSEIDAWTDYAIAQHEANRRRPIVLLVPARPDTAWWARLETAASVCYWRGRLRFVTSPDGERLTRGTSAPFPSALCYLGPAHRRFARLARKHGRVLPPARAA